MFIDIGLPPVATLLIATMVFAIVSDFLLETISVRLSLSTGRLQNYIFEQFGQNLFLDFIFSIVFQLLSFRKKAFFGQLASFLNVGSFNRAQTLLILFGGFIGVGLCMSIFFLINPIVGLGLCGLSLLLGVFKKDQLKDVGISSLCLGVLFICFSLFSEYLASSSVSIYNYQVSEIFVLALVVATSVFFRTPIAFLIVVSLFHHFIGLNIYWFVWLNFIHAVFLLGPFYLTVLAKRSRLYFCASVAGLLLLVQLAINFLLFELAGESLLTMVAESPSYLQTFQQVLLYFVIYMAISMVLLSPFMFLATLLPLVKANPSGNKQSQKIILSESRGSCYSVHFSLLLLRQEFKKFTTSVHTIFKLSRETKYGEDQINQKFARYQGMLLRVGEELRELCFSIGRQRSYRWHVKEIMSYYRYVNQLELLTDDLGYVAILLRQENLEEEFEKDCRYWLGLQLLLFESFLDYALGADKEDPLKVQNNIEKSYEILDRFFVEKEKHGLQKDSSQTFYRITESIAHLAL